MQWELVVALVVAIPLILFPAAYVWYINIGGLVATLKESREKQAAPGKNTRRNEATLQEQEYNNALVEALRRYPRI
jgi:hypothetical protein